MIFKISSSADIFVFRCLLCVTTYEMQNSKCLGRATSGLNIHCFENQNIKSKELLFIPNFVEYINAKHTPPSFKHIITETRYMTF